MGFLDDAKKLASEHADAVSSAIDKAEQLASEKTGGKYDEQIKKATDAVQSKLTGNQE